MPNVARPVFFETANEFGAWLATHESVDEALCVGWIDGVRKNIDARSYQIRFTPRKPTSNWSAIIIERVRVLQGLGRMREAGLPAYAHRRDTRSRIYANEQADRAVLRRAESAQFRRNKAAWKFFEAQPPGCRHLALWRIVSAKRAETRQARQARLAKLIEASGRGGVFERRAPPLASQSARLNDGTAACTR